MGKQYYYIIVFSLFLLLVPLQADARENMDVGISLSKSCLTMLKNNMTTNCPTYEELNTLFPDTSNQEISGKFVVKDGIWQRDSTRYNSHYNWYAYSDKITWIDPPGDLVGRIPTITIETKLPEYLLRGSNEMSNNTIILGHSRYVDDRCYRATITADEWVFLTGDTINLLLHDCDPKYTTFDHIKKTYLEATIHDITTTYKYKLDTWIAETKKNCLGLCREY